MMLSAFIDNIFIQMALFASLLASVSSGVIGSFVVVKRISFIAGSISHSVLGGMGLCLWLQRTQGWSWLDPIWGAFASAIGAALLLGWIHLNYKQREDSVISAIWSTGIAIGMIFIALTPGTNVELFNYLFGNVLWISDKDLYRLLALNLVVLAVVAINYKKFLTICFDEEQALLQGIAVQRLYLLLLSLVAISVVLLMQIIGTILAMALLTIPATVAGLFTRRLSSMMLLAVATCALFSIIGLNLATNLNWPPAATVSLVAATGYLLSLFLKRKQRIQIHIDKAKALQ
jgi:zinc transport system permease protein